MTQVGSAGTIEKVEAPPKRDRLKLTTAERRTMRQQWEEKTFKRETAMIGLAVWFVMTVIATTTFLILPFFSTIDAVKLTAMGSAFGNIYTIATTMIFVFAGAAFGVDAYAKQIK